MREVAELLHRLGDRPGQLVQDRLCLGRVGFDQTLGRAQVRRQPDQVLLRPVVQVALDPAPLGVGGGHDARA